MRLCSANPLLKKYIQAFLKCREEFKKEREYAKRHNRLDPKDAITPLYLNKEIVVRCNVTDLKV